MDIEAAPHHFDTCFFSKSLNSKHLLPWSSNVPKIRKINILKIENLRIERNCSKVEFKHISKQFQKSRFKGNKYPANMIEKHINNITPPTLHRNSQERSTNNIRRM